MTHSLPEVRQLIPAPDWYARFLIPDGDEEHEWNRPLVAWAVLAEPLSFEGRSTTVVGLVASTLVEPCERDNEFAGYFHASEIAEEEAHRASSGEQVRA